MSSARRRFALPGAVLLLSALACAPAQARPSLAAQAKSRVLAQVAKVAPSARRASCARRGRAVSWRCTWSARKRTGDVSCKGTSAAWRARRSWRVRILRRRCTAAKGKPGSGGGGTPGSGTGAGGNGSPGSGSGRRVAVGFNDNSVAQEIISPERDAELAQGAGADVVRLTFNWRWAEPNPGEYHLEMYDRIYAALRAKGIRPLFILLFSPPWAWDPSVSCTSYCMYPPGPAHYDDAGRMAARLATRYPEAAGIEIWNEPNLAFFWRPGPDPDAYTALLKASYSAVKRANPRMPVVGGGLNDVQNNSATANSLPDFLAAVYQLGGGPYMDAIGFHPYPLATTNTLLRRSVDQVREILRNFHDTKKPLWATEVGLTTSDSRTPVSESAQADAVVSQYRALSAMPDVDMVLFHTLIEFGDGAGDPEFGYGILRPDFSPKPAYCALARVWGGSGCLPG